MTRIQRLDVARARRLQPGEFTVRHDADARRLSRRSAARDVDPEVFPVPAPPPPPASPSPPWLSGAAPKPPGRASRARTVSENDNTLVAVLATIDFPPTPAIMAFHHPHLDAHRTT